MEADIDLSEQMMHKIHLFQVCLQMHLMLFFIVARCDTLLRYVYDDIQDYRVEFVVEDGS